MQHEDQLALLKADPSLINSTVEELLRYDSPVQRNRRIATRTLDLRGRTIRRGDSVLVFMGSAHRDSTRFANPDDLNITRAPNPHMAFGYGIHFCLGAALTRIEAPLAISTFVDRFPTVRLADDFDEQWRPNMTFRGLRTLDVIVS
jgi:cytochrome P450